MVKRKPRPVLRGFVCLIIAAVLVVLDQLTKYLVLQNLSDGRVLTVIDGLLEFSYTENTGAAFGILKDRAWFITAVGVVVSVVILLILFRYKSHTVFSLSACSLLLAGGIGNMIDRVRLGFVVDFIHVLFFPYIFNFADCCVTVGTCLFILHVILSLRAEKMEDGAKEGEE